MPFIHIFVPIKQKSFLTYLKINTIQLIKIDENAFEEKRGMQMRAEEYLNLLETRLERYFDIEKNIMCRNMEVDIFARSFIRNERYIASKKLAVYAYENNEYCFVKRYKMISEESLTQFTDFLKNAVNDYITPHGEHMSSVLSGIMIFEEEPGEEIRKQLKAFKFHKSFAFGFKGWVDIRLISVVLARGEVITNKKGKEVQQFYKVS
ncbi:MAG: hypothetical protein K0R93_2298 [Anaerosolibacter sp.]|nr:hypothetical protein [Anaerosolibacter sp.]